MEMESLMLPRRQEEGINHLYGAFPPVSCGANTGGELALVFGCAKGYFLRHPTQRNMVQTLVEGTCGKQGCKAGFTSLLPNARPQIQPFSP